MPKKESGELIRQGRELVKQSKQLCDVSRERIERGKHLGEDAGEQTSKADRRNPKERV